MAKTTIFFAVALIALGVAFFVATGSHAPTALIPALFGVVLWICGLLARTENSKRRMLVMHIAVTIALLGFLFPGIRALGDGMRLLRGQTVLRPLAMWEELAMAALCLILVALSVRSFIAARRERVQA
jgi:hypothetical protein